MSKDCSAIRWESPAGRVRWQPVMPDGSRAVHNEYPYWKHPSSPAFDAYGPRLYRTYDGALRVAKREWRKRLRSTMFATEGS